MSDHSITSLIEKLEGAEVGSRELDSAVHRALEPIAWREFIASPRLTASLDAALALAERVLGEEAALSILQDTVDAWNAAAGLSIKSLPRLFCAAILRAQSEAR